MKALLLLCMGLAAVMAWSLWRLRRDLVVHRRTEAALRTSERHFRLLADNLPGVIYLWRNDHRYTTLYLSDKVEALTGYPKEDFLEHRVGFGTLYHPENDVGAIWNAVDQALAENRPFHLVYRIRHRRVGWRWVEEFGAGVFDEKTGELQYLEGFLSDITERKKGEEALHESQRALATLLSNLPGMVYRCRNDRNWTMEFVSEGCFGLTGHQPADLIQNRQVAYADLIHPDDQEPVWTEVQQALAEKRVFRLTYRLRSATGEEKWVWEQGRGVFSEDGNLQALEGFIADITDRREAEEALRESRRMLQLVLDTIPARVFWKDRHSVYLGCNRRFALDASLGSPEGIVGKTDYDLAWKREETDFYRECDRRVMETHTPEYHIIEPQLQADGREAWLDTHKIPLCDAAGNVVGILGTYEDITERKRAEEGLRESEQRFRELSEATFEAVAIHQEGVVMEANSRFFEMFGYAPEEIIGRQVRDMLIAPESIDLVMEHVRQGKTGPYEAVGFRRDGTRFPLEIRAKNTQYHGRPVRVVAMRDLTDRKRSEEERRQLEAQIQYAQKLESLGVLAGGIAHDFNNLLVGILGNAGLALAELPPESPARETLKRIETTAQRAAELTQQMLAYSGKGRFVLEALNLSTLVEEMAHLLQVSISKKSILRFNLARDLPLIQGDATQVRQVVMNLITNASDAIGDASGVIAVSTGVVHADRAYLSDLYLHDERAEGDYVHVEVTDTGCGMDAETLSKVFDPFFTTKFSGRGLGLSAVLGIVRGHKGGLKVHSVPGQGTTFRVLLPALSAPPPEGAAGAKPIAEPVWRGTGTVLVVDDEEAVRAVAKMALERAGFCVLLAADGQQAMEVFHEHSGEIAVVLLDMTMPRLGGEEVFRELRRLHPEVRVLLSSGYSEQDAVEPFAGKGLSGFVQKPYRPTDLIAKVRAALGEHDVGTR